MSMTGLPAFDSTLHITNTWLKQLGEELGGADRHRAYQAMRAVLHALRDRLTVDEVATLGAQLPMLVRGIYYEGWHPANKPLKARTRDAFLAHVIDCLGGVRDGDPETVTRAVFGLLGQHVSAGEIGGIRHALPRELDDLWPTESPKGFRVTVRA